MKWLPSVSLMLLSINAHALTDVKLHGTTQYALPIPAHNSGFKAQLPKTPKRISLLNLDLSDKAWDKIDKQAATLSSEPVLPIAPNHPGKRVQLAMNQVPVMDQGPYGTCVTFAATAAVDAALNRGDYISQLCQLELGQYLSRHSNLPSGWDGSMGSIVLNQMYNFGFVSKRTERNGACAGLMHYPIDGAIPDAELSLSDYYLMSEDMDTEYHSISWSSMMDPFQAFVDEIDKEHVLNAVKDSLNNGDRLLLGVMLFAPESCVIGACGQHHVPYDTWVVTPMIKAIINSHGPHGGHEMVITGYDDNATATDEKGRTYQGLLTLRNSWGPDVGDSGDFYMTYDYFKLLVSEVQRIRVL